MSCSYEKCPSHFDGATIVPLTPREDEEMAAEEAQRLEWEKAQLTGEPMTESPTAGQLGLCGQGANACAPRCCEPGASVEELAEVIASNVRMTRAEAIADAQLAVRGPGFVPDEPMVRLAVDVMEPGWAPKLAELLGGAHMSILLQAEKITNGQRQKDYGTALDNHERIARFWTAFLQNLGFDIVIQPEWVAEMMILMKVARIQNDITEDGLVDIAGYANVIHKMGPQRAERAARLADEL